MSVAPQRDEWLPLVTPSGVNIGSARRSEVHGNPALLHPVVHCLVTNRRGELLLQLRGRNKDVQPGRWDTSVGGHVGLDETIQDAVVREIKEELGVTAPVNALGFLYRYVMQSTIESELVHSFHWVADGPFLAEPGEIEALRFWSNAEIDSTLGTGAFTPNFEDEYQRYLQWLAAPA